MITKQKQNNQFSILSNVNLKQKFTNFCSCSSSSSFSPKKPKFSQFRSEEMATLSNSIAMPINQQTHFLSGDDHFNLSGTHFIGFFNCKFKFFFSICNFISSFLLVREMFDLYSLMLTSKRIFFFSGFFGILFEWIYVNIFGVNWW